MHLLATRFTCWGDDRCFQRKIGVKTYLMASRSPLNSTTYNTLQSTRREEWRRMNEYARRVFDRSWQLAKPVLSERSRPFFRDCTWPIDDPAVHSRPVFAYPLLSRSSTWSARDRRRKTCNNDLIKFEARVPLSLITLWNGRLCPKPHFYSCMIGLLMVE